MKILHTSDWHLGKKLDGYARLPEQELVMNEICEIAEKQNVEAVIIAGDIFDTYNPPIEALELFYKTVKRLSKNANVPIIAIAGNHDSPDRIEAPDPLAKENGIFLIGYPNTKLKKLELETGLKITNTDEGFIEFLLPENKTPLRVITTPYANEQRLKTFFEIENQEQELRDILKEKWQFLADKYCDNKGVNILVSHHFFVKEGEKAIEESDDEKPILYVGGAQAIYTNSIPKQIQYTALGHLHRYQEITGNLSPTVYCGTPIAYSFGESNQEKFVAIINAEANKNVEIEKITLKEGKKLLRKKFDNIDDAILWLKDNHTHLIELTIVADNYLSSPDRQRLYDAHSGIISIIPEIKNKNAGKNNENAIDLKQDITPLFKQFFKHKEGQEPNDRIMNLFKEVLAK